MQFLLGLLPGLFIGIALGLTGTIIGRHARLVAKGLVKAAILLGGALRRLLAGARRRLDALVAEARSEMAKADAEREQELVLGPWGERDIRRGATGKHDESNR